MLHVITTLALALAAIALVGCSGGKEQSSVRTHKGETSPVKVAYSARVATKGLALEQGEVNATILQFNLSTDTQGVTLVSDGAPTGATLELPSGLDALNMALGAVTVSGVLRYEVNGQTREVEFANEDASAQLDATGEDLVLRWDIFVTAEPVVEASGDVQSASYTLPGSQAPDVVNSAGNVRVAFNVESCSAVVSSTQDDAGTVQVEYTEDGDCGDVWAVVSGGDFNATLDTNGALATVGKDDLVAGNSLNLYVEIYKGDERISEGSIAIGKDADLPSVVRWE